MLRLLASIHKELLLLVRDRAGLLILFLMPAALVLVISLVQDNVFRLAGRTAIQMAFVDLDRGELGQVLRQRLVETEAVELVPLNDAGGVEQARRAVRQGRYQFAVIVPEGFSTQLEQRVREQVRRSLQSDATADAATPVPELELAVLFDPTVRGAFRTAVTSALRLALLNLEVEQKSQAFAAELPGVIDRQLRSRMGGLFGSGLSVGNLPIDWQLSRAPVLGLAEQAAFSERYPVLPTSVQQNVPAWTLFGMFFIILPLAGTLIRERQEGTLQRLLAMPVSGAVLLTGKLAAYLLVCLGQCLLMLLVGLLVLPLFGLPVLSFGSDPWALLLIAVCAALAASGFGLLLGSLAHSYEQASTLGAVSVVIAAALGGIMVPVYAMPRSLQTLSDLSPLCWGLEAFLDIFVRGGTVATVLPQLLQLFTFFVVTLGLSILVMTWRRQRGA